MGLMLDVAHSGGMCPGQIDSCGQEHQGWSSGVWCGQAWRALCGAWYVPRSPISATTWLYDTEEVTPY